MGLVSQYWQLVVLRILTGISLGGSFPLIFSLMGDLCSEKHRASVGAGLQIATGAGFAVGQIIASSVGKNTKPPATPRGPKFSFCRQTIFRLLQ